MRVQLWAISTCLLLNAVAFFYGSDPAHAFASGITGFSGRQGVICNSCHVGGTAPAVDFEGPTTVAPGSTTTYRFSVRSQASAQIAAGLDIAVTAGSLTAVDGENTRIQAGELVHNAPRMNVDGIASWEFTWTAPAAPGSVTMFGAGNSVNLRDATLGDRATGTTLVIDVAAVIDTPTPSPTPTSDSTATPTPTLAPIACVGDCDGNGVVAVNELVTGTNILLDRADISACEDFDTDGSGTVTVNELVSGVNALLRGCTSDL